MRSCDISNQTGVLSHILILILNFPKRNQSTSTVLCQQNYTGLNLKKVATTTTEKTICRTAEMSFANLYSGEWVGGALSKLWTKEIAKTKTLCFPCSWEQRC